IIVPTNTPGVTITAPYDKMGVRGSDTAQIVLKDVRVPKENLLGGETNGFKQFLKTLDSGRISIGALAIGIARASLERSIEYPKERVRSGKPISKLQGIQFKIAAMATYIQIASTMVHKAAWLKDQVRPL